MRHAEWLLPTLRCLQLAPPAKRQAGLLNIVGNYASLRKNRWGESQWLT